AGALATDMAAQADYVLLLHDDTFLAPDAVASLVEAAERIDGVGVVGPKVLDWDEPAILRDIGLSTDRFGYPYSPLEEGEIDQGQYDRIREVLFVSSCAMLVSRPAWARIGPPDERFASGAEELDFCRRALARAWLRLQGWASSAAQGMLREREAEAEPAAPLRTRIVRFAVAHPVTAAWAFAIVVALIAYRHLFVASPLVGGALRVPPP